MNKDSLKLAGRDSFEEFAEGFAVGGSDDDISISDIWLTIHRRKWVILACALLCLAAAGAYCTFRTPRYTATAQVQLDDDAANSLNLQDLGISMPGGADEQTKMETQVR